MDQNSNFQTNNTPAAEELIKNLARIRSTRTLMSEKTDSVLAWGQAMPPTLSTSEVSQLLALQEKIRSNVASDSAKPAADLANVVDGFYSEVMADIRRATKAVDSLRNSTTSYSSTANPPVQPVNVIDVDAKVVSNTI
jgi:hypothetical protein